MLPLYTILISHKLCQERCALRFPGILVGEKRSKIQWWLGGECPERVPVSSWAVWGRAVSSAVVVSIHDVAPAYTAEVVWLLRQLDAIDAVPRSLLVIPYERGQDDVRQSAELVALLQEEQARGSEIVLHGYTHRRAGAWRGSPLTIARAAGFARHVAEFASLDWQEQRDRLLRGRQLLAEIGLQTSVFCPPGWLHTGELPDLLREIGFRALVEMLWLHDVECRRRVVTPWFGYMGAGVLNETLTQLGAIALTPWRTSARVLSVFFHPQGASRSRVCAHTLQMLAQVLDRGARPMTYAQVLDVVH